MYPTFTTYFLIQDLFIRLSVEHNTKQSQDTQLIQTFHYHMTDILRYTQIATKYPVDDKNGVPIRWSCELSYITV